MLGPVKPGDDGFLPRANFAPHWRKAASIPLNGATAASTKFGILMNRNDLPPIMPPPSELPPEVPRGFMARFRNYFLTGLIVAGPIAITFYLTWWFVTWVDGLVRPFVPVAYRPETYLPFGLPGSGLIVAVIALTLLGFLTANLIGRTLVDLGENCWGGCRWCARSIAA